MIAQSFFILVLHILSASLEGAHSAAAAAAAQHEADVAVANKKVNVMLKQNFKASFCLYAQEFGEAATTDQVMVAINRAQNVQDTGIALTLKDVRVVEGVGTAKEYSEIEEGTREPILTQLTNYFPLWRVPKYLFKGKYGNQICLTLTNEAQEKMNDTYKKRQAAATAQEAARKFYEPSSTILFYLRAGEKIETIGEFLNTVPTSIVATQILQKLKLASTIQPTDLRVLQGLNTAQDFEAFHKDAHAKKDAGVKKDAAAKKPPVLNLSGLTELVGQLPHTVSDGNIYITVSPRACKRVLQGHSLDNTTGVPPSPILVTTTTAASAASSSSSSSSSASSSSTPTTPKTPLSSASAPLSVAHQMAAHAKSVAAAAAAATLSSIPDTPLADTTKK